MSDQTVAACNAEAIASQWWGVHQIDSAPTQLLTHGRNTRQIWCDASGEAVLEVNMISGMGHGTPIDKNIYGTPGPYMLDVGISSTQQIARFWGIEDGEALPSTMLKRSKVVDSQPPKGSQPNAGSRKSARSPNLSTAQNSETSPALGVQQIIENALRLSGLIR